MVLEQLDPPAGEPPARRLCTFGPAARVVALVGAALAHEPGRYQHAWVATAAMPALRDLLVADGLRPARTGWEWMVLRAAPAVVPVDPRLRVLAPADRAAATACLAEANPTTEAVPLTDGERWWGVDGPDGTLLGVIGATPRPGRVDGPGSWHLHGLGVRSAARGQGLGAALTAGAARTLLAEGAGWVSLGMWDDNDRARRIYHRIGFRTVHRLTTLHRG